MADLWWPVALAVFVGTVVGVVMALALAALVGLVWGAVDVWRDGAPGRRARREWRRSQERRLDVSRL